MKAKDFLKNDTSVNAKYIADKMWPTNKAAKVYLSQKLNGVRPWTENDEIEAKKMLNELADKLKEVGR